MPCGNRALSQSISFLVPLPQLGRNAHCIVVLNAISHLASLTPHALYSSGFCQTNDVDHGDGVTPRGAPDVNIDGHNIDVSISSLNSSND